MTGTVDLLKFVRDGKLDEVEKLGEVEDQGYGCHRLSVEGKDGLLCGSRDKAIHGMRTGGPGALKLRCYEEAIIEDPEAHDGASFKDNFHQDAECVGTQQPAL